MNFNKAIIAGRLTQNIELRSTPSNQSVAQMGLATNRTWVEKDGTKQEQTEFHNIVLWGRTAEVCAQYLKKGDTVLVEGRLQTRNWTDKQGQERKTTEIIADKVEFMPKAKAAIASDDEAPYPPLHGR